METGVDVDKLRTRADAAPRPQRPVQAVDVDAMFADLMARVKEYNPNANFDTLREAFRVANAAHSTQTRRSGEPYIVHPIEVARILTTLKMDTASVAAALLHDTVEDTALTIEQTRDMFGSEVAQLVDGVTKLTAISDGKPHSGGSAVSKADAQAENLRKILLAMAKDIRVILIKLADRLHNLRTLGSLAEDKQRRIAQESLEIFAPIASRLGIWKLKWEIEDLAFMYLHPEEYRQTVELVSKQRQEREKVIPIVMEALQTKLAELNVTAHLEWRPKHFYSIFQKMQKKHRGLDEIYDLIAVRIIVNTQEECYTALGGVHSLWMPIKDRIKDYIAVPKSNHYRSLHTTVFGPGDEPLEIQIRTWEMHKVNDYGIAAHWAYKEGREYNKEVNLAREIYPWVRLILDWQDESKDAREYVENLKLDVLSSEVFVFTPNGDVLDLPAGSTPLDFAYRVHTDVGHRCVGGKVNTRLVPLDYQLQNGDIVEILTSKHSTPSRDWLKICKSPHARSKIRLWFKKERREENIARGHELLEKELKRHRLEYLMSDTPVMLRVAAGYNLHTIDDLLAALGYSEIHTAQIIDRLKEIVPAAFKTEEETLVVPRRPTRRKQSRHNVIVKGLDNLLVKFSRCCTPVPGDEIIGFVTMGKGVSVHRRGCANYMAQSREQPDRVIPCSWDVPGNEPIYTVDIEVEAFDRPGLLSDIMMVVNDSKVPAKSCSARTRGDRALVKLSLEIAHKQQLEDLMKRVGRLKNVIIVERASHANSSREPQD